MIRSILKKLKGSNKKYGRLIFVFLPLVVGAITYRLARKQPTIFETWFFNGKQTTGNSAIANWLPDYCWSVSFLSAMVLVWNGWNKIPIGWKWMLWLMITGSEWLQYAGLIPGTADIVDVLVYQLSFFTVYILHQIHAL